MRILVTLDFPPERGGIQRYLGGIVRHTYQSTDMVLVGSKIRPDSGFDCPCELRYFGTFLSRINKKLSLIPLTFALLKVLKNSGSTKPLIECGNVYAALSPWFLSFFTECDYSVYTYGTELKHLARRGVRSLLLKKVLSGAQKLITLGSYTSTLLKNGGIDKPLETVFPKIEMPPISIREKTKGVFRILTVGRLVYHKGHDLLLEALSVLPLPEEWSLVIAGSGPEKKRVERLIKKLGLSNRVKIREHLCDQELSDEYRQADLFVLCSRDCKSGTEGFGIVLLEAMAHGIPVVAAASGGISEVLDYGRCGLLFDGNDVFALARSIMIMYQDYAFRERCVCEALVKLKESHVW